MKLKKVIENWKRGIKAETLRKGKRERDMKKEREWNRQRRKCKER